MTGSRVEAISSEVRWLFPCPLGIGVKVFRLRSLLIATAQWLWDCEPPAQLDFPGRSMLENLEAK